MRKTRKGVPEDFLRLIALGHRLKPKGWKPLSIHSSSAAFRRQFNAGGRDWEMALNPSVHPVSALLNLWFVPTPSAKPRDWKRIDRLPFCTALDRKMRLLRFLKVFGCASGGRILYYKRLTAFRQIAWNWKRLAAVKMETLDGRPIPDSAPVPRPIGPVHQLLRERLLWDLVGHVQRNEAKGLRSHHLAFGLTIHEKAAGHRWTINWGIYWHHRPGDVDPPSTFWAALLIWPPSGFSRGDRKVLEKSGFYSRVSRSLRKLRFKGRWVDLQGGFADFSRHRLRWKDVQPLCDEVQGWSLKGALAEFPSLGRPERIHPIRRV